MPLIPSLMRRVVRDRVHPYALALLHSSRIDERGLLQRERTARQRHMWPAGISLGWCLQATRVVTWVQIFPLWAFFWANLLVALCFSVQLHPELVFFFCLWQRRMSGSVRCEPSRKSELWHAVKNRRGGQIIYRQSDASRLILFGSHKREKKK